MKTYTPFRIIIFLILFNGVMSSVDDIIKEADIFVDKLFSLFHPKDPEEDMTMIEVIQYHGYPVEEYNFTTEDGYTLYIQRIPHGKKNNNTSGHRKPVLILPGLYCNSASWIANIPDKNLPYLLAENGYDVYLGNFRGSFPERDHLPSRYGKYWKYCFDEMAKYDLPSMINFILERTGFTQLHYIGHSLGTTTLFALLSSKTEYNEKIRSFHALAPVVNMDHVRSPMFLIFIQLVKFVPNFPDLFGDLEILTHSPLNDLVGDTICKDNLKMICPIVDFLFDGFDLSQANVSRYPVYMHFYPTGSSLRILFHFGQISVNHRFQSYDYGEQGNKKIYNQSTPLLYDVTKITAPVAIYWSENDWLSTEEDVANLIQTLNTTVILNYKVPYEKFNHQDFMWAIDVVPLLYEKLIETMQHLWNDN